MTTLTDRSRIISFQTCPRKRLLSYHYKGHGIQLDRLNKDLFVGICVHKGLEYLLNKAKQGQEVGEPFEPEFIDEAVEGALEEYDEALMQSQFDDDGEPQFMYYELRSLVEALIRIYAKVQLPKLLAEYEVLEVEKELEFWLVEPLSPVCKVCLGKGSYTQTLGGGFGMPYNEPPTRTCYRCKGTGVIEPEDDGILFLSRPDGILRRKRDGAIVVLSFKTASSVPTDRQMFDNWNNQNKYDMQGISETVAVEAWLTENWQAGEIMRMNGQITESVQVPTKVSGVKMEFLIKGTKVGQGINKGILNNPILHPWYNEQLGEYAGRFEFEDLSGNKKELGKGWNRINIWEQGDEALKEWIDLLAQEDMDLLRSFVVTPDLYYRNEDDIKDWLESIVAQEQWIQNNVQSFNQIDPSSILNYKGFLNEAFPKFRHSCFSYSHRCQFFEICWHGLSSDSQDFVEREGNHQKEKELIQIMKEAK